MDVTITSFLIFLLQYHKTTMVGQNEWLALPIWHLVGQVPYLPIMFLYPCSQQCQHTASKKTFNGAMRT